MQVKKVRVGVLAWILSGLLGWGWMNYSAFSADGPRADADPLKWSMLAQAPLFGPVMILVNAGVCIMHYELHVGLRFE